MVTRQIKSRTAANTANPEYRSTLRSFLGMMKISRDFIENYAEQLFPLYKLLKKGNNWEWGLEQQKALTQLKQTLVQALAEAYPKIVLPFVLQLANTNTGLSAVLSQDHGTGLRPMAYASRILNGVEQGFTPCEKEVLALVWVLQYWEYLAGLSLFTSKTSHSPVKYVVMGKTNDGHVSSP